MANRFLHFKSEAITGNDISVLGLSSIAAQRASAIARRNRIQTPSSRGVTLVASLLAHFWRPHFFPNQEASLRIWFFEVSPTDLQPASSVRMAKMRALAIKR